MKILLPAQPYKSAHTSESAIANTRKPVSTSTLKKIVVIGSVETKLAIKDTKDPASLETHVHGSTRVSFYMTKKRTSKRMLQLTSNMKWRRSSTQKMQKSIVDRALCRLG